MEKIPMKGIKAYLSQSDNHQILFMQFSEDVELPQHSHAAQVGFVLDGGIDLVIEGNKNTYGKGDRYYIPAGPFPDQAVSSQGDPAVSCYG